MKKILTILLSVAMCFCLIGVNENKVKAETPNYLTFTAAVGNSTITFEWVQGTDVMYKASSTNVQYGSESASTDWSTYSSNTTITLTSANDTVSFKGTNVITNYNCHFVMTGSIFASGDVTSLTNGLGGEIDLSSIEAYEDYYEQYKEGGNGGCYQMMFLGCTSLKSAPNLPSEALLGRCYMCMFSGCTNLEAAPSLPSTSLAEYCYKEMFYGCTSLVSAPSLPATTLAESCYYKMFSGCSSLVSAPSLPATTLANSCYEGMFDGCTSLKTIPNLPATTLADYCYAGMFAGCTGIELSTEKTGNYTKEYRIPTSGNATVGENPLVGMFDNTGGTFKGTPSIDTTYYLCEEPDYLTFTANVNDSSVNIEKVGNPTAVVGLEYSKNGSVWTPYTPTNTPNWIDLQKGDYVKFRATSNSVQNFSEDSDKYYRFEFSYPVSASGNIMSLLDKTCNTTEIPCEYCFNNLFNNCSQLTSAPILPATTLTAHCYESMFYGCTSLASAPTLPATTLADYCYGNMFMGCTNLTSAPVLSATTLKNNCYYNMFAMCTSLEAPASMSQVETLADNCCFCMYLECSQLKLYDTNVNSGYKTAWTIPNITEATTWNTFMLAGCKYNDITPIIDYDNSIVTYGTTDFTGTPSINTTYYVKGTSLPSSSGSLVEYDATKGFDCEYIKGKMTTTTAHITDADMSDFVTVRDKNRVLDNGIDYTLEYGSIKVVFQPAYLDTLDVGVHVLNINVKSTDYKVTITVKNGETSNTPKGNNIGYTPVNTGTK